MTKVSVVILTYNQKNFIAKAIESALAQKTNFDFEILVGDDCSTDGAQAVIQSYSSQYPDKVKAVCHPKNLGQNGLYNTIETLKLAQGQYIAPMDGDDYWIDACKLQKQVDFMEAHPDFSACFHNALVTYEDGTPAHELDSSDQKQVITAEDLIGEEEIWFMATSAVMFKNGIMYYPDWFLRSTSGDIPRYVILAKKGPIGYVEGVMSVYRKNRGGASFKDHYRDARFLNNRIQMYEGINKELDFQYDKTLKRNIARYYRMLLDARQYQKSHFRRAGIALKYIYLGKPDVETSKEVIRDYVLPKWMLKAYSFFALLMQQTNFPFEIVVGDDASTDNAQAIISEYAARFPDKIRAFLHPQNLGPTTPREFGGRNNVLFLLKACQGQYVALCEGDDFWTDSLKLQKQVDFLDKNPNFSICHHNLEVIYEDNSPAHLFNDEAQKAVSTIKDLLEDRWFIGTASLMYRNPFQTEDFAAWHHRAAAGDWALVIQLAARGKIGYLDEIMGVYRKHKGGLSHVHAVTNAYFLQNRRQMFADVNEWLQLEYDSTVQQTLLKYDQLLAEHQVKDGHS